MKQTVLSYLKLRGQMNMKQTINKQYVLIKRHITKMLKRNINYNYVKVGMCNGLSKDINMMDREVL